MTSHFGSVQDVLNNYASSVLNQDVEQFLAGYAEDIHIFDCWGNWECVGLAAWKRNVVEWFEGLREEKVMLRTDLDDIVIEEASDAAFAYCAITFAAHDEAGQRLRAMTNRFTFGLRKTNDSWLIKHEHSSLPIDMQTGKGMFNAKPARQ